MAIKRVRVIRKRSIGTLAVLLFVLSFSITPALLFSDLNFGPGLKNPTEEEQYLNLSTNYLFKGTSYIFNLDDFYDDTNLYKVYTGAKFQTEAFNGTSLEWSGTISNDTVTPVDNDETQYGTPSGVFNGTHDFREFADGTEGYDITGFADYYTAGTGTSGKIISEMGDHKKVLELKDQSATGAVAIRHNFDYTEVDSTIEFWLACNVTTSGYRGLYVYFYDQNLVNTMVLVITNTVLQYYNGTSDYTIYTITANEFFHVKMVLDDTADTYDVYVNDDLKESDINYINPSTSNAYRIYFATRSSNTGYKMYVDAVSYSADPDYTIGENLYPDNINMISGSYDYTDNMKINDDSSTNFTSTHTDGWFYETPHQWDDFTFTNGTGDTIGEIETIDANYSVIRSAGIQGHYNASYSFIDQPVGTSGLDINFIDEVIIPAGSSITIGAQVVGHNNILDFYQANSGAYLTAKNIFSAQESGTVEYWYRTTYYRFQALNLQDVASQVGPYLGNIGDGFFGYNDGAWHPIAACVTNQWYHIRIDFECDADGYMGLLADTWRIFIDDVEYGPYPFRFVLTSVDRFNVAFYKCVVATPYHSYFDAVGYNWLSNYTIGDNRYPYLDLDVQVDIQVDDVDCSSIEYFKYSHKTNISATIDLDIWNWDTSTWFEIESVDNFATFDDDSFILGSGSDYVNETFGVRIRFQINIELNVFELQIDRLRLDYLTIPAELEMTITFSFANYNEDLLAMTVQSWQRTNISQTIAFKIWNYDTEDYVQISSSSETSFINKEYNTESPNDFISPSGVVKLYWIGSNTTNNFELHIDYLFIQTYYKLDLVYSKSFDTNGIYRYRWAVLGSIQYTQWITFEVVDPEPNFHAISESDNPTRWLLQGAELSPFENFTDDIDPSSAWDLYDVSPDDFNKYVPELDNYLTDYITFYGSSYESPAQWDDFDFTKGAGNTIGELETNDADEAIVDSGYTLGGQTELGDINPYDTDILTGWNEGDGTPHWSKLDEGDAAPDGGNIRETSFGVYDKWNFETLTIPAGRVVTGLRFRSYCQREVAKDSIIRATSSVGATGDWVPNEGAYGQEDIIINGLDFGQTELNGFWMQVEPLYLMYQGWVDLEAVYVTVYTSLKRYSMDYTITWDVDDPESIENFSYDYRTTTAIDCDLDIYNWDTTGWLELESNTDVNWHADNYILTDPYISVSDEIKIRFQSALSNTDFDMELDMIVLEYNSLYTISKKHNNTIPGYAYMQTNTTELISLNSSVYGTNYTLSSGDYFEVDFQTSSDSQINLVLLRDGVVNKTLIVSSIGNTNFNRHTVQIPVDETVEFDQLRFGSTFWDKDYFKCWDIKTYKYEITGDTADFYVGSHQDHNVYLIPDFYNLKIFEGVDKKIDENITIVSGSNDYIYKPTEVIQCRITLFTPEKETYLQFENYHIKINRCLSGEYNQFDLVDVIFYADIETDVYIEVYDRFDSSINNFTRSTTDVYIDLEIEVYSLEIINLMTQMTTIDINTTLYESELASGRWINFMLSKQYYQIGYYNPSNIYTQFIIYLDSNQVYELNMSRICNLYYTNQRMEPLSFYQFKTYINGTRIINNMFYATDGEHKGIEVKDLSDISVLNHTYVEGTEEFNQISLILTQYSLKVMSQQLCFNHINITRDPAYYNSSYYWSEWIAPSEIIDFRLFPGYYKINLTNNEDGGYSYYSYNFTGDDILLIGSNNTIYNVLVNIANVNTTIGNQITNVEINITNQNSAINNTVVNIEINLSNVNSTLGTLLLDINTAISNINSSIITEIVSLSTELSNINSSITNEILTVSADLSNVNSSVISQLLTLGVDISNINGSIVNQIIDLGVDITNINTSLSNQILSIGVDISNLDTSITDQIVLVISNITNINTTLSTQITSLSSDITNLNSTIVNQIVALGVDITNINTSLSNQILSLEVDISNLDTSITEQILLVIADIENIETVIDDQTLIILSDITNVNSTLLNQMVVLGVDITNINASITNQILDLSVDLTNINSSISNLLTNINISITNLENDIGTFYAFTNTSFINLNNVMNTSFINIETTIYSINQTISNLVIGVSNDIYLINGTISTMISQLETNLLLMNVSIDTALFDLGTTLNLIGSNITSNYILLNNSIYLNSLNINDSRIAIINNLMLINNTISALVSEVYSAVYLINNSIYTAVVDLGTYLSLMNNTINGNLSIVLQMNEFLTEIYKMTMFSDLLNWTDIGLNTSLLTSQIDVWTFINNYKNQSIEIHLRYQDLIEELMISADDLLEQYLPNEGVEYREWSEELQEYIGEWTELDPDEKSVDFGFYETEVPSDPLPQFVELLVQWLIIGIFVLIPVVIAIYVGYKMKISDIKDKQKARAKGTNPISTAKTPYF